MWTHGTKCSCHRPHCAPAGSGNAAPLAHDYSDVLRHACGHTARSSQGLGTMEPSVNRKTDSLRCTHIMGYLTPSGRRYVQRRVKQGLFLEAACGVKNNSEDYTQLNAIYMRSKIEKLKRIMCRDVCLMKPGRNKGKNT